ncbi:MAG: hypothetical protein NT069_13475 [Planctomycetota bacterium]|nr:hypothetical protein [Planctomycetota bacterium]
MLLTIVCGVFWILNHKWYNEEKTKTAQAEAAKKSSDAGLNRMIAQTGELKRILGIPLDDLGDDESNPRNATEKRGNRAGQLQSATENGAGDVSEQAERNAGPNRRAEKSPRSG